jgi:hypothetical protein
MFCIDNNLLQEVRAPIAHYQLPLTSRIICCCLCFVNKKQFLLGGLSRNDVALGRGTGVNNHAGNKAFRLLAEKRAPFYRDQRDGQKKNLAKEIVKAVHDAGGKFYEKKTGEVGWQEVPDKRACDKAQALLRDYASNPPPGTPPPLTTKKPTVVITPERPSVSTTMLKTYYCSTRQPGGAGTAVDHYHHHHHHVSASSSPLSPPIVPCLAHHAPAPVAAWTSVEDITIMMPHDDSFSPEFLARLCYDEDDHCNEPAALVQQQQLPVLSPPPFVLTPRMSSAADEPLFDTWQYDDLLGDEGDMAVCDGNNDDDSMTWSFAY